MFNWLTLAEDYRDTLPADRVTQRPPRGGAPPFDGPPYFPPAGLPQPFPSQSGGLFEALVESSGGVNAVEIPVTSNGYSAAVGDGAVPPPDQRLAALPRTFYLPYQLEAGPRRLEESTTVSIPGGVWVDLDASSPSQFGTPADVDGDGSGIGDPYAPFTIMFSPTGQVVGEFASASRLQFYVADEDTLLLAGATAPTPGAAWTQLPGPDHMRSSAATYDLWATQGGSVARNAPFPRPILVPALPLVDHRVITVVTRTGAITSSIIDPTDALDNSTIGGTLAGPPDGWADYPFIRSRDGRTSE